MKRCHTHPGRFHFSWRVPPLCSRVGQWTFHGCFPTARVIPLLCLRKPGRSGAYPRQRGPELGNKPGGQRPNSCACSSVHPQGCEPGGGPGVWTHAMPARAAAWQAPRGEGSTRKPGWIEIILFLDGALAQARRLPKC